MTDLHSAGDMAIAVLGAVSKADSSSAVAAVFILALLLAFSAYGLYLTHEIVMFILKPLLKLLFQHLRAPRQDG